MALHSVFGAAHMLQTVAVASVVFAAYWLLSHFNFKSQLAKLPSFAHDDDTKKRNTYLRSAKKLYKDGYEQFKDSVYRLTTLDAVETVVVAPRFLPELRKLPENVLNFPLAIAQNLEVKYTKLKVDDSLAAHTVRANLTPALLRLNPIICTEVDEAIRDEMPPCKDWTSVLIFMNLTAVVAKVSGRVFVGPELCREKEYVESGIHYTMELINASRAVKQMKPWLRPFLANRLPEILRLRKREETARKILHPVVQARREASQDPSFQKPDDMLQWMINRSADFGLDSTEKIAKIQLGLIFAAIHTTTTTVTNILYSLAVTPEYIQPLREEVRTAMTANDGIITSRALQQMEKLDSFMKETFRFYPPAFTSFSRRVLKGITLSNGQHIPAGVNIEVPGWAMQHDSDIFPDGENFDGYRFYKLRQQGGATNHARNQFVTTNEQNLGFGYGRHACPGRFFAANEIKMILARLVLEYDFKNVDGIRERYANYEIGRTTTPDPTKQLLFKKVET